MNELALFAGIGGGILAGDNLGWVTRCAVEIDPYARAVLLARQRDGALPRFPIWDDIRTFDGGPWRGHIDIVSGGFPCQDISRAGSKAGIAGPRSGLWGQMARVVREVGPRFVFVENSADLAFRGLDRVLSDLAEMGLDAEWGVLSACATGAPHTRERLFVVAHANGLHGETGMGEWQAREGSLQCRTHTEMQTNWLDSVATNARGPDGAAHRVDRLRCIGNAQVPEQAKRAWLELYIRRFAP